MKFVLSLPYAGITQFKFNGTSFRNLSLLQHPESFDNGTIH